MVIGCNECGAKPEAIGKDFGCAANAWNTRSGSQGVVTEEMVDRHYEGMKAVIEQNLASMRCNSVGVVLFTRSEARAALLAAMGGKQGDKLSIAPTGIAFHNSTSAPPPTTISEERAR